MKRRWLWIGFASYGLLMLWLLFGQRIGAGPAEDYWVKVMQSLNLKPFDTIRRFLWVLQNSPGTGLATHAVINLAGNVLMFVPMGFFLPAIWKNLRNFWWFLLCALLVIAAVELIQLVTLLGSCDVDDLFLNMIGVVLGYLLWIPFAKKFEN